MARSGVHVTAIKSPSRISKNIFSLGQMRADTGRGILYEQALAIRSGNGYSIVTGCAHPGILRIVKRGIRLFKTPPYAICGGFHMKDNSKGNNIKIVTKLQALGIQKVLPLHCSGISSVRLFDHFYRRNRLQIREGECINL